MDLAKKPQYALIGSIAGICINITLMYVLIPKYSIYGALTALLVSAVVITTINVWLAHHFYKRKFLANKVIQIFVVLFIFFYLGSLVETSFRINDFLIKSIITVVYSLIIVFLIFGYKEIKKQILTTYKKYVNK